MALRCWTADRREVSTHLIVDLLNDVTVIIHNLRSIRFHVLVLLLRILLETSNTRSKILPRVDALLFQYPAVATEASVRCRSRL